MFAKKLAFSTFKSQSSRLTQVAPKCFFMTRGFINSQTRILQTSRFNFATQAQPPSPMDFIQSKVEGKSGKNKITAKTLCDITGTRYYLHNEEIGFHPEKMVRVYDENETLIGDITFGTALESAQIAKKDLVLRNDKVEPPVCKIMHYKMELLKKLFKKLGTQAEEKEMKSKTLRLSTTIAIHDLENKKKKAVEFLKSHANLKIYMKVNIYDEENIQKGRLMLMNIAEDLKEYAKIKVSPMDDEKMREPEKDKKPVAGGKKPTKLEDIKKSVETQKLKKGEIHSVDDYEDDDDFEGKGNYIYMELQSTVAFKQIDIDKMLQHTNLDDFLRGLYLKAIGGAGGAVQAQTDQDKMLNQLFETGEDKRQEKKVGSSGGPELMFEEHNKETEMLRGDNLRKLALQNLRDRRKRQKQSEIFNQTESTKQQEEMEEGSKSEASMLSSDRIDLTKTQLINEQDDEDQQLDDFDLLEAKVDPKDIRTQDKIARLQDEIESEKVKIKCKFFFKYSFQSHDPLKITE